MKTQIELRVKESKKKKKKLLWWQKKYPVYRFLDPYQNYNLFGDIVLPNSFWQNKQKIVYPLELFLDYKAIRQIHFRENGIIFELEAFNENQLSSIPFLQDRLRSLGDFQAWDLAEFLEFYNEYFLNDEIPVQQSMFGEVLDEENDSVFEWVDKIFDSNRENIVFMKGNKMINKKDFRAQFLCYNNKILEILTREKNFFSEKFIQDCFRESFFTDLHGFTNLVRNFCLTNLIDVMKGKLITKPINTIVGRINISVKFYSVLLPKKNLYFHYWIHEKENYDQKMLDKMEMIANFDEKMKAKLKGEDQQKEVVGHYSNLMRTYYCLSDKI